MKIVKTHLPTLPADVAEDFYSGKYGLGEVQRRGTTYQHGSLDEDWAMVGKVFSTAWKGLGYLLIGITFLICCFTVPHIAAVIALAWAVWRMR